MQKTLLMDTIKTDKYCFEPVLLLINSLASHIRLQETARKKGFEIWLSALYRNGRIFSIRSSGNIMKSN